MSRRLSSISPASVWTLFEDLSAIPRPSGAEKACVDFICQRLGPHATSVVTDSAGNLVIRIPPRQAFEKAPTLILQSHLDMVTEKNLDSDHDFRRDPIRPRVVDDWVCASGTTLGADNGLGVAMIIALAESDQPHGTLELLFTVEEETGLVGASRLDPSLLTGKWLVNLDSEEDGTIYIGCAGGADIQLNLPVQRQPIDAGATVYTLRLAGLIGGHSGLDIHRNRANAIRSLVALLRPGVENHQLRLIALTGGNKRNAIPRECAAVVAMAKNQLEELRSSLEAARNDLAVEYTGSDDRFDFKIEPSATPVMGRLADDSARRLINLLLALPHGVATLSRTMPDLVETSSNIATVTTESDLVETTVSCRSSQSIALQSIQRQILACSQLADARTTLYDKYPGWQPNPDSTLLKLASHVYTERVKRPVKTKAIHAGLECGILSERLGGVDAISFGPQIEGAHSPDERVNIPSTARCFTFLQALVAAIARID